jgi:hypothetical protein
MYKHDLGQGLVIELDHPDDLNKPDVEVQILKLIKQREGNPLYKYFPHPKQLAFHRFVRQIRVFLGGNRSGKSVAGILDDLINAVDREALPPWLEQFKIWEAPFRCRIITPDFGRPFHAVLETIRQWVPPSQLQGGSWEKAYSDKNHVLNFANGSFFEFMTQEQDVSKFGGTTRERIHFDEEPKGEKGQEIREECAWRLVESRGDELFTFTNASGHLGWTYDDLWEGKGAEKEAKIWVNDEMVLVKASNKENPHLDEQGRQEAESKTRPGMLAARVSGDFTHAQGLVYEGFGDQHLFKQDPPTDSEDDSAKWIANLTQYDGIDPGVRATAVLFGGFDSDNILWIYDELFLSGKFAIPEFAAEKIRAKRAEWRLTASPTKHTLIDPASASRNVQTGERTDMAYRRAGIKTIPAKNEVEPGIFEVLRRLEHVDEDGDPSPLIRINERCERLRWEIGRYRMESNPDGSFDVVKRDDHGVDVMRYLCFWRPLARKTRTTSGPTGKKWIPGTAPEEQTTIKRTSGPLGIFT